MAKKYCMLIVDGMADLPQARTKKQTPLEVARTPAMDRMACQGRQGMVKTIPDNWPGDSLLGVLSLLGLDPLRQNPGQGVCEAIANGISVAPDEWVFCCYLLSTFEGILEDPRAGQIRQHEAEVLIHDLNLFLANKGVRLIVGQGHRHFFVCRGKFDGITSFNPYVLRGKLLSDHYPQGTGSEQLISIMQEAHSFLQDHEINKIRRELRENPADAIWLWGGGTPPHCPSFRELHKQSGAMISSLPEMQGLGRLLGMDVVPVQELSGSPSVNAAYTARVDNVLRMWERVDFVCLHLGMLVEVSRYGDVGQKVRLLEQIDDKLVAPLCKNLPANGRLLLVGGHFISVQERVGSSRPVPFVIHGKDLPTVTGLTFHERQAQQSNCLLADGSQLLKMLWAS